jgi:hypothetical protein
MKLAFLSFALLSCLMGTAQESMVSCRYRKTYLGIDNPLDIFVEGYGCSSISVTTDNGKLVKYGCQYVYRPSQEGEVTFTIYKKQNGKTVKLRTHRLPVDRMPSPLLYVGGYPSGSAIPRAAFIAQAGIAANPHVTHLPYYRVDSFSVVIIYDSTIQSTSHTAGNLFDEKMTAAFRKMEPGSTVLFFNIWVTGPDGKPFKVQPLEYIIN